MRWLEIQNKLRAIQHLLPEYFKDGESLVEVCCTLGITRRDFLRMVTEDAEFEQAYYQAVEAAEAWWNKLGRYGAAGKVRINSTVWMAVMKNRYNWKDKREVDVLAASITGLPGAPETNEMADEIDARAFLENAGLLQPVVIPESSGNENTAPRQIREKVLKPKKGDYDDGETTRHTPRTVKPAKKEKTPKPKTKTKKTTTKKPKAKK